MKCSRQALLNFKEYVKLSSGYLLYSDGETVLPTFLQNLGSLEAHHHPLWRHQNWDSLQIFSTEHQFLHPGRCYCCRCHSHYPLRNSWLSCFGCSLRLTRPHTVYVRSQFAFFVVAVVSFSRLEALFRSPSSYYSIKRLPSAVEQRGDVKQEVDMDVGENHFQGRRCLKMPMRRNFQMEFTANICVWG